MTYPAWNLRTQASYIPFPGDSAGIWTWDTLANWAGVQDATVSQNFTGASFPNVYYNGFSLLGSSASFVQANSVSSVSALSIHTFSMRFVESVQTGSVVVVDIYSYMEADSNILSVTDSAGNAYTNILQNANPSGVHYWWSFIATNVTGGPLTITVVTHGVGGGSTGTVLQYGMAVHEYAGVTGVDNSLSLYIEGETANPVALNASLTTANPSELIHAYIADVNFVALIPPATSPTIVTTSSPSQPILLPPGVTPINDKTLPVYSLNFPMSNCEELNPCRQHYPLL